MLVSVNVSVFVLVMHFHMPAAAARARVPKTVSFIAILIDSVSLHASLLRHIPCDEWQANN